MRLKNAIISEHRDSRQIRDMQIEVRLSHFECGQPIQGLLK